MFCFFNELILCRYFMLNNCNSDGDINLLFKTLVFCYFFFFFFGGGVINCYKLDYFSLIICSVRNSGL